MEMPQTDSVKTILLKKLGKYTFLDGIYFNVQINTDGTLLLFNRDANLFAFGNDISGALDDLEDELGFAWSQYVECDELELHESGLKYRGWLKSHVVCKDL